MTPAERTATLEEIQTLAAELGPMCPCTNCGTSILFADNGRGGGAWYHVDTKRATCRATAADPSPEWLDRMVHLTELLESVGVEL